MDDLDAEWSETELAPRRGHFNRAFERVGLDGSRLFSTPEDIVDTALSVLALSGIGADPNSDLPSRIRCMRRERLTLCLDLTRCLDQEGAAVIGLTVDDEDGQTYSVVTDTELSLSWTRRGMGEYAGVATLVGK